MTWSWNLHEKLQLHKSNLFVTTTFQFVEVIKIQSRAVFTDHSKIFIPQQIWKLLWLMCTLKKQLTNQNDEVHNPFSF